ncbi:MAG: hypothetical protein Q7T27_08105 [Pseudomonas sp.]|uniref:hypothetical protein n=1 Tax=Pseudomonas sp. TaxID=306 RepID=UPI0027169F73|nr:hypothetical protein [Pseudomonas sp.]MDO8403444.1 hypothetical protein [Pseudomonas sp.]
MNHVKRNPLDPDFGEKGKTVIRIPEAGIEVSRIHGLAIDANEKVLFTSSTTVGFVLGRLLKDGSTDRLFGHQGFIVDRFHDGGKSTGSAISILKNGTLLLSGSHQAEGSRFLPALARFDESGHYDSHFGEFGKIVIPLPESSADANDFPAPERSASSASSNNPVILPDGKILLVYEGWLIRLTADGQPDSNFHEGKHYKSARHPEHPSLTRRIVQTSADTVVLGGFAVVNDQRAVLLARYFVNGELDTSFANQGFALLNDFDFHSVDVDIAVKDQSKILVFAQKSDSDRSQGMLVCLDENGHYDTSFNNGQPVLLPTEPDRSYSWHAGLIDAKGQIFACGGSMEGIGRPYYTVTAKFLESGELQEEWINFAGQLSEAVATDQQRRIVIGGITREDSMLPAIFCYLD